MTRGIVLALVAIAALAACEKNPNRILYDGVDFRPKLDKTGDDGRAFLVTVKDGQVRPTAARKAAAHVAVQYCLKKFGGSEITWGDDGTADAARLLTAEGVLVRQGRCDHR